MLKILYLDGFKYLGQSSLFSDCEHLGDGNFRKNCTYIHLSTTDWSKDRNYLEFLKIHIPAIEYVKEMIQKRIDDEPTKKTFHIVIRQDDDDKATYFRESFYVGYTEPKNVKSYIKEAKIYFESVGEHRNYRNFTIQLPKKLRRQSTEI